MSSVRSALDVNRGPHLLAIFWTEFTIATVFMFLRLYVRQKIRTLGWDDITMLFTLILFAVTMSLCSVLVHYGLGRHIEFVPLDQQAEVLKWNWLVQPFGIMTLPMGKISVSLLLLRLMSPQTNWRKAILWGNMVTYTIFMALAAIFSFVQCDPPQALWEDMPNTKCWNPKVQANWAIAGSAYGAFLDFLLVLMPVTIVWNLQLSLKRKSALCILLGLGVLSGICAAIKTAQAQELGVRIDSTWALFSLYAWSSSEIFLIIICGCSPTLVPLYEAVFHQRPLDDGWKCRGTSDYRLQATRSADDRLVGTAESLSSTTNHTAFRYLPRYDPVLVHHISDCNGEQPVMTSHYVI
ncbi:MAG: hypothetical protein M1822_009579 [Bathelium mastoideum]|nr:MAG: hypothetical protein M1822_009579 [Bathelium mastoideum]